MLSQITTVELPRIHARTIYDFMLSLDAKTYQRWHREHRDFRLVKGTLDNPGSIMYFDEFIGKTRIRGNWTVLAIKSDSQILFKARRLIPVYLKLTVQQKDGGVVVEHELTVGFKSALLQPFNRIIAWLLFTPQLREELDRHVNEEFKSLEKLL